jgi:hypothetical protein
MRSGMPDQVLLATQLDDVLEAHRKATRGDVFLAEMDESCRGRNGALIELFFCKRMY